MSPNLYDMLDVDRDASTEEIEEAWRHAIADLGPTDRRFRAYNDAAGVLLDPQRRATYDAELAAEEAEEAEDEAAEADTAEADAAGAEGEDDVEEAEPAQREHTAESSSATSAFASRPSQRLIGGVAAVALVVVLATVWVLTWPGTFGTSPEERAEMQGRIAQSIDAAERIAPQVLSYDYRNMGDERLAELQDLMTPAYAEEWAGVQKALRDQAQQQKAVVTAAVRGSAVSGISDDGGQAEVLVFVDQLVQKSGRTETELTMWATLRLIRDGTTWRLEKICTTDPECA